MSGKKSRFAEWQKRVRWLWSRGIWDAEYVDNKSARGKLYAAMRILSLSASGFQKNNIMVRAAALSYSSLIGLAPMVAIIVMISGFILKKQGGEAFAAQQITKLIMYVAPSTAEYGKVHARPEGEVAEADAIDDEVTSGELSEEAKLLAAEAEVEEEAEVSLNPELLKILNGIIQSTQSGGAGLVGILMLFFIGIQLLTSIEKTLNDIWGVSKGRTMMGRVRDYWLVITLGSILSFSAVSTLTGASIVNSLDILDKLPGGATLARIILSLAPLFSYGLIVLLLTLFYWYFPHTTVRVRAAFAGAVCVALLLVLNNYLSFLYVGQVVNNKSLYGSIAIVPVLMFGMFVFWIFILTGGQITYAFQSADTLANRDAWHNVSLRARETLCLATFILISRRFEACQQPYSFDELAIATRAPSRLLNECLAQLIKIELIHAISNDDDEDGKSEYKYAPAMPTDKISLGKFKDAWESSGNNDGLELLMKIDPVIEKYRADYGSFASGERTDMTVREALEKYS